MNIVKDLRKYNRIHFSALGTFLTEDPFRDKVLPEGYFLEATLVGCQLSAFLSVCSKNPIILLGVFYPGRPIELRRKFISDRDANISGRNDVPNPLTHVGFAPYEVICSPQGVHDKSH